MKCEGIKEINSNELLVPLIIINNIIFPNHMD